MLRTATAIPDATFRAGQFEAIDSLINSSSRLLVVQRTGWGKSMVYFIATRILRRRGAGATLLISPLLALMRNQMLSAQRLRLDADSVNSTNKSDWRTVRERLLGNEIDLLLVSPERLANEELVEDYLLPMAGNVGMLVVDEAHCISDWGHDFRPDYRRIAQLIRRIPRGCPILATTATASRRVVSDLVTQLGHFETLRGPLERLSLQLQNHSLPSVEGRLAWLARVVPTLPGSGIIYVLTVADSMQVAAWLRSRGIDAHAYYGGLETDARVELEERLLGNQVKALVATSALGMGFDKPDLSFVIHYQIPQSVVHYYQQVGRAGRALPSALGVLLSGQEDEAIHAHFIRTAFPPPETMEELVRLLEDSEGLRRSDLEARMNLRSGKLLQLLKLLTLEDPPPIVKHGNLYKRSLHPYTVDRERIERLARQRSEESAQMAEYVRSERCLMQFLLEALDQPESLPCGRCAVCRGEPLVPLEDDPDLEEQARIFLGKQYLSLKPRQRIPPDVFPEYGWTGNLAGHAEGRALVQWGQGRIGRLVRQGKESGSFDPWLAQELTRCVRESGWNPAWVTCVPSLTNPELVPGLAREVASRLGVEFRSSVRKVRANQPQKNQENSWHQCRNLDGVFAVENVLAGPVLLVDDAVDSGWTFAVVSALLLQAGVECVYPIALTSTAPTGD
ncbi:RecQ family ATP-dependent DNA helicase [bacterium CPR1]|nr:RecQ family ATP-dependent DNA helicase [bacterium CPR1]